MIIGIWIKIENRALGSGVGIYTHPGSTPSVWKLWVLTQSSSGAGGVPGLGGTGRSGGALVPWCQYWVCGFFRVRFLQEGQPAISLSRTIARCLSIGALTVIYPGNTTPHYFPSRTLAGGFLISFCISSLAARENPSVAILAIFKARHMSDCSSCTRSACLAIVAEMSKTYTKVVAASRVRIGCYPNPIRLHSCL